MHKFMFGLVFVAFAVFSSGCGDSRTSATLRSPEQIKAVTDTFVIGSTSISTVENSLGLWNSASKKDEPLSVNYWTNDGGETTINFGADCPSTPAGSGGCYSSAVHMN